MSALLLSNGNDKLNETAKILKKMTGKRVKIASFNLPAFKAADGFRVCAGAADCASVCYARQGTFLFASSRRVREDNLAFLKETYKSGGEDAVFFALLNLISNDKATHYRIHDSGDFFALWYARVWVRVAEACPDRTFYAYTKSVPFFKNMTVPSNFALTYSYGGVWDNQIPEGAPVARIFVSHDDLNAAGYIDGNSEEMADAHAIIGTKKIGLVYHGVKNMTAEEKAKFSA